MRKICFLLVVCSLLALVGCAAKVPEPPQQAVNYFTAEHLDAKSDAAKTVDLGKVKLPHGADKLKSQIDAISFGKKLAVNLHAKKLYAEHSLASVVRATEDGSWQFTFSVSPENTASNDKSVLYVVLTDNGELTDAWVIES
ncbi:MAG: hypothetical protein II955_02675 [Clostridia bacterium]|nr:hypothetical protein [Clostridia bacterium]